MKQLIVGIAVFLAIDSIWLLTAGQYAMKMNERIQGSPVTFGLVAALIVYIALSYLVYQVNTVVEAGLLGGAVYAVYDFTNLALLKKYETGLAIADTLWGSVLFASVFSVLKYIKLH